MLLINRIGCFLTLSIGVAHAGFFDWAFGKNAEEGNVVDHSMGSSLGKLVSVPFEMRTADEKFLVEGSKYGLQTSDLDICHHKVIMQLKKSCSSLTEEDIGKLSVHLLNCQSSVEGRRTFECTKEMNIAQCTKNMDPNTWNSYHIVSNRARAVCYASRQQQFSAKTEMTVNKLVWTSEQQISALKKLEEGQIKVGELTSKTLDTMAVGQRELAERQELLKSSQKHIQTYVHGNLRELTREKSLIAAGHKELATMTEAIQKKLDYASKQMMDNEDTRKVNHKELIQDLSLVQEKAKEMWLKIDNSTQRLLQQHSDAVLHYQITLKNLERINTTVSYLLKLVDQAKIEVDAKLGWLSGFLFDAGDRLNVIYCCVVHGAYFLVSAITGSFLNAPFYFRAAVVFLIPINALSEIKQQQSLDLTSLTILLAATLVFHWFFSSARACMALRQPLFRVCYHVHNSIKNTFDRVTFKITQKVDEKKEKMFMVQCMNHNSSYGNLASSVLSDDLSASENMPDIDMSGDNAFKPESSTPNASPSFKHSQVPTDELDTTVRSFSSSVLSRRLSSNGQNPKKLCAGRNKAGTPCKGVASNNKEYCYRHLHQE